MYANPHTQYLVQEFHVKFGHPIGRTPTMLEPKLAELRVRLIAEELCEYAAAMGIALHIDLNPHHSNPLAVQPHVAVQHQEWAAVSLTGAADALGDLDYVVQGANVCHGFPGADILAEIHRSNMSKLGSNGEPIYREDGKIMKGPNYAPPNVARVISEYVEFCNSPLGGEDPQGNYPLKCGQLDWFPD